MMNKKAEISGLPIIIMVIVLGGFSLFLGVQLIEYFRLSTISGGNIVQYFKTNYGATTNLLYDPTNIISTRFNQTFLNFSEDNQGFIPSRSLYSANNSNNQLTVSIWVNMTDYFFKGQYADSVHEFTNFFAKANSSKCEWEFRMENSSGHNPDARPCRISFYVFNTTCGLGAGSFIQINNSIDSCPEQENKWMHIVGRINGTYVAIFYNTAPAADTDPLSTYGIVLNGTNTPISLGRDYDNSPGSWDGQLDDVRIYNKSLTNTEINMLWEAGRDNANITKPLYNNSWLNFTNNNSYLSTTFTNISGNMSFTGWYFLEENNTAHTIIGGTSGTGFYIRIDANLAIRFFPNSTQGTSWSLAGRTKVWDFFAVTFNNNSGNATLYINGVNNNSGLTNATLSPLTSGNLQVGRRTASATTYMYWNGSLDGLRVYNRVLNISDVQEIYNAGKGNNTLQPAGLSVKYDFDNNHFATAVDTSGNSYNGTWNGNITEGSDNIFVRNVTYSTTNNLVGWWKMNEGNGSTIYDSTQYSNNGSFSTTNISWRNDGIIYTLLNGTEYSVSNKVYTLINLDYLYNTINITYSYGLEQVSSDKISDLSLSLGNFSDYWQLIVLAVVISVVIGLILLALPNKKVK